MAAPIFWLGQNELFELTASADWTPVYAWETDDSGKRRPSSRQALDPAGLPVWTIQVIGRQDIYGRAEEGFLTLRTGSTTKPTRESLSMQGVAA